MRTSIENLDRYIATTQTSKHRIFQFLASRIVPDQKLVVIALNDPYFLGILSSSIHVMWATEAGGWLGVGNDPVYNHSRCFDPFPFPDRTPEQEQKIRGLGERLDAHRKRVQAQHPEVTITGMYNLLEKLRKGEAFSESDRAYNDKALVSTLKQIHDELDVAVFEAYGWQPDLSDEEILERLVKLNAERAEEERNGIIRWLRPEYQAPNEVRTQQVLEGIVAEETVIAPVEQKPFPKQPKEQLAAIRDLLRTSGGEWTVLQIAAQFKGGGRYKGAIAENLERLEWFGVLLCREDGHTKRWQFADSSAQAA
ncbi:class I SAM-dependent DNA methyltransferase [Phormidium sp. CLA17]|nr:class I SAM-dependent DNA methyltransferase [Leptolyngbya sp. Cla-17]